MDCWFAFFLKAEEANRLEFCPVLILALVLFFAPMEEVSSAASAEVKLFDSVPSLTLETLYGVFLAGMTLYLPAEALSDCLCPSRVSVMAETAAFDHL